MTLGLEPLPSMTCADRSVLSTLGQALDLCDELGAGMGVAVDVCHVWWDPELEAQMARAGSRIAGLHVCDWLAPTTDLVFDRGMVGDGAIDTPAIRAMAEAAGYRGDVECELLSRRWWGEDPDRVLRVIKERHAAAC